MRRLVVQRGTDILRSKGILAFANEERRFVLQGVRMLLDGDLQAPWRPGQARVSRLVLIGRNLDRAELERGFGTCVAA